MDIPKERETQGYSAARREWGMGNGEWGMGNGEWGMVIEIAYPIMV